MASRKNYGENCGLKRGPKTAKFSGTMQNIFNLNFVEGKALQGLNSPAQGDALGLERDYILNPEGVAPGLRIYSFKKEFNPFRVVCLSPLTETQGDALGSRM